MPRRGIVNYAVVTAAGVLVAVAVADSLRSKRPASAPATAPSATTTLAPRLSAAQRTSSQERRIEWIGNRWAALFAADGGACRHMTQPLCERIACERVGGVKIRSCKPPTPPFRRSFEAAVVEEVAIKGNRAAARFSNGVVVRFWGDAGTWMIDEIGGSAGRGLFE